MKTILCYCAILFSVFEINSISVFDLNIFDVEGRDIPLGNYAGKRLMIVVLPVTHSAQDSILLQQLNTLSLEYQDSITCVGIPSYEDGFDDDSTASVMNWYHSILDSQFVISGAMNTRKNSPYQTPLFSFLTHADQNSYFDDDVYGAGEKFFFDINGKLSGISTPDAAFDENVFKKLTHL